MGKLHTPFDIKWIHAPLMKQDAYFKINRKGVL